MVKSVYLLSEGEYSSYRIVGVFSTEENAIIAQQSFDPDTRSSDIFEMFLDPGVDKYRQGLSKFKVNFKGIQLRSVRRVLEDVGHESKIHALTSRGVKTEYSEIFVWAKDEESAIKIAAEKLAQLQYDESRGLGGLNANVSSVS